MEFKFDTKPNYTLITPVATVLDANLTGALQGEIAALIAADAANFVINLQYCASADDMSFDGLISLHEESYTQNSSLVFTGLQQPVAKSLQLAGLSDTLNIAPTMQEAIDIINMEILERDLFNEE